MKRSLVTSGLSISFCLIALAGCASKPTTVADRMHEHVVEEQKQVDLKDQLAKDWEKGEKLIATGEKRIKDGEKRVHSAERDLKSGQDDIERGRREISEGQQLIYESERKFREHYPDLDIRTGN